MNELELQRIRERVAESVDLWAEWIAERWKLESTDGEKVRRRVCRKCANSRFLYYVGMSQTIPHSARHAFVTRMEKLVEDFLDEYIEEHLPHLWHEQEEEQLWKAGRYTSQDSIPVEYRGLEIEPEPVDPNNPYLFTLRELEEHGEEAYTLPRPPLTEEEKQALREEIAVADRVSHRNGMQICEELQRHRNRVLMVLKIYVEPRVDEAMSTFLQAIDDYRF